MIPFSFLRSCMIMLVAQAVSPFTRILKVQHPSFPIRVRSQWLGRFGCTLTSLSSFHVRFFFPILKGGLRSGQCENVPCPPTLPGVLLVTLFCVELTPAPHILGYLYPPSCTSDFDGVLRRRLFLKLLHVPIPMSRSSVWSALAKRKCPAPFLPVSWAPNLNFKITRGKD